MSIDDMALSPTQRSTVRRGRARARLVRAELADVLASARICHLGVVIDGAPRVLPTVYGVDLEGPDRGGTLYLHGSVAARSLVVAPDADICVTVTTVDGLVLARSGFHHSMNYRSAVVLGRPRLVTDAAERGRALDAIVDQVIPGRSQHLRAHTKKELAATVVLALALYEASVKTRDGGPVDDDVDIEADRVWAGVVPIGEWVGVAEPADNLGSCVNQPAHVSALCSASPGRG
ncbi:pyridoxamine 5'-phosphate oxidase family protein [Rhodococcus sovatensis]|uniref:Pyridoxamine 5'-phosphate oxidase family protein n=1 Tax=Rhodococcus sovatensis TaxID=1805840 RepID=A0ABZ2PHG5_9NOCA